jgi:hypothetical protein
MSDYPKHYRKADKTKTASNRRQEVQLKFDGYVQVDAPESQPAPEPDLSGDSARPDAPSGADASGTVRSDETDDAPVLTEAEMAKLPEAKDAEVVDLTVDKPSPAPKPRRN